MGKLKRAYIQTVDIPVEGTDEKITIQGLSVYDLDKVFVLHGDLITQVFDEYIQKNGDRIPDVGELVKLISNDLKSIIPTLIILASNNDVKDKEQLEIASMLPIGTQLNCLVEIIALTVTSVDTLKKILWKVISGMQSLEEMMTVDTNPTQSTMSVGDSGKKSRSAKAKGK